MLLEAEPHMPQGDTFLTDKQGMGLESTEEKPD